MDVVLITSFFHVDLKTFSPWFRCSLSYLLLRRFFLYLLTSLIILLKFFIMYHLVYFSYCRPILLKSSVILRTLEDYINLLPVPLGGLLFDVYNEYGRFYGRLERLHEHFLVTFTKNRLYETKNPGFIHFAEKASDLDAYTSYLLGRYYPKSIDSEFVCFNSEDFNQD